MNPNNRYTVSKPKHFPAYLTSVWFFFMNKLYRHGILNSPHTYFITQFSLYMQTFPNLVL